MSRGDTEEPPASLDCRQAFVHVEDPMHEVNMTELQILDVHTLEVHLQEDLKTMEVNLGCHLPLLVNSQPQVIDQVRLGPGAEHSGGRILIELKESAWARST
jgi:hypothetical protein